jgi:Flp pilus assembly protein TadD
MDSQSKRKPGRNDPCHCGSSKKYKRCCLPDEEAAQAVVRRATQERLDAEARQRRAESVQFHEQLAMLRAAAEDEARLIDESNAIVDLIHEGLFDEAEQRARALMEAEPDFPDGLERLGHVYEKRGDFKSAAKSYRDAATLYTPADEGCPEDDHQRWLLDLADRLDPPQHE